MFLKKFNKLLKPFKKVNLYSKRTPPIGVDDFRDIVDDKEILYVDKTSMIKELVDDKSKVVLITRPRRWGKTLNMSMIQHFFAPSVLGKKTKGIFHDYNISKIEGGKYLEEHQGKYPVIYITFKDLTKDNFPDFLEKFSFFISELYTEHQYLLEYTKPHEKHAFNQYLFGNASQAKLEVSLYFLSRLLHDYHQKRAFILIDEYDTPLQHAYVKDQQKFFEGVASFMRNLFSSTLKNNRYLHKAILTGVLRIAKANLFTGVNNFNEFTMLNQRYSTCFGYSDLEIKFMLQESELKMTSFDSIKQWYNGYRIYHQLYTIHGQSTNLLNKMVN